ncbi:MAG: ribosomal protein L16 [Nitrosopumilales archaeon]|nr:ribosomal protein L16 [Nitrosopumilales archaeon]
MHGANYRRGNGQPYTRKEFIKGKPQIKIAKFSGGQMGDYDYCVQLLVNEKIQVTHMAATAGADRLQEGMRRAFGKAVSLAARLKAGQIVMEMFVKKEHLDAAKKALKSACVKLSGTPTIKVIPLKKS